MKNEGQRKYLFTNIATVAVFLSTYAFSIWIFKYYTGGDQRYYIALYDRLRFVPFNYVSEIQFQLTGSREPLYGTLMWLCAPVIDKNIIISFFNAILSSSLFIFLKRNRASVLFMMLTATNFYILVIMTSAERLKFAYLFAVLAAILPVTWRWLSLLCSLLSHFSIMIVFSAVLLPQRIQDALRSFHRGGFYAAKSVLTVILIFGSFIAFCFLFRDALLGKIEHYKSSGIMDMGSAAVLLALSLFVTTDRKKMLLTLSFPLLATFAFGGDRVNMLTATVFLYAAVKEGKTNHPIVIAVMLYLSYKSIDFIQDVLAYGTGFVT